jgi:hypothetical protein
MSKLGEPNINGPVQQIGESFARTLEDAVSPGLVSDVVIETARSVTKTRMPEGATTKQLVDYVALKLGQQASGSIRFKDRAENKFPEAGILPQERDLTPVELEQVSQELDRQKLAVQVARKLKDIARTVDPTPNIMASTVGSSLALIPLSGLSLGLGAAAYTNMEYDKLRVEQPNMPVEQAAALSALSGSIQAPFDLLEGSLLMGKVPFLKDMIKGATASALIKRGIVRTAASGAIENFAEFVQDGSTIVLQEMAKEIDANIQGIDFGEGFTSGFSFEKKLEEFKDERANVAIGMIPLMLIGVGVGGVNDFKQANLVSILSDDNVARYGVDEETRNAVRDLRDKGDLEGAVDAFRNGFATATSERTAEALKAQREKIDTQQRTSP